MLGDLLEHVAECVPTLGHYPSAHARCPPAPTLQAALGSNRIVFESPADKFQRPRVAPYRSEIS
jgi:hypothetical protein